MRSLVVTGVLCVLGTVCNAQEGNYTSLTFKRSVWSSSSYVGDLSDWVYFGDGRATVVEYKAPESSFSLSAAIRQTEEGDSELESVVGATRIGDYYLKFETGGADGLLYNPDPLEPVLMPQQKNFSASLNMLAIGKDWDIGYGVKYGYAWVNLVQPAQIDLTYYEPFASAGISGAPTWAESAVDPAFENNLLGVWVEIDSLKSFMKGEGTFYSNPTVSGRWIRGMALDMEAVVGYYFGTPGTDLTSQIRDAYGLNYEYVDTQGLGWYISYKLAYNLIYKLDQASTFGLQLGVEGRAFQVLMELGSDEEVSSRDQVLGKIGIGDNSSNQWGPYIRLAMEF